MFSIFREKKTIDPHESIPDRAHYRIFAGGMETFHPWDIDSDIVKAYDDVRRLDLKCLVSPEKLTVLKWAHEQTRLLAGETWEAGVYQGGAANFLKNLMLKSRPKEMVLRLFDSFQGLPERTEGIDLHHKGDFSDITTTQVNVLLGYDHLAGKNKFIDMRIGRIPETFAGLEDKKIRLAHIDVDLYQPVLDCLEFLYSRTVPGGILISDDYGFISCPGARKAVEEFFFDKPESILAMPSGQAMIMKL